MGTRRRRHTGGRSEQQRGRTSPERVHRGITTLLTIALSINQLVLSRVFGPIDTLVARLTGSRDQRQTVESIAGVPSSPNDPADLLSLVATTLSDRADGPVAASDGTDWTTPPEVTSALRDVAAYGERISCSAPGIDRRTAPRRATGSRSADSRGPHRHLFCAVIADIPAEAVGTTIYGNYVARTTGRAGREFK